MTHTHATINRHPTQVKRQFDRVQNIRPSLAECSGRCGGLGLGNLGDHLIRDIAWHRLIVRELHGVRSAAAGHTAQLPNVAEHFR